MIHNHICPYCWTPLGIDHVPEKKVASRCPACHKVLIVSDHGATVKKPYVYRCHKCGKDIILEERMPIVRCDNCGTIYMTAPKDECMIDIELLYKGDKGELPYTKKKDRYVAILNKWRMLSGVTKAVMVASVFAVVGLLGFAYYSSLPSPIESSLAYANMDVLWKEFRGRNPFSFQMCGLKRFEDNSYVAVVSEPTEDVSEQALQKVFKKYNCCFRTHRQKIGYDGWLRDAVISFNGASPKDIPSIARKLSKLLYGTDYKAGFMDYSVLPEHTAFSDQDLNYQISAEELRQWFITDKELLADMDRPDMTTTLEEALTDRKAGMRVLMSKTAGFVVWLLDKGDCNYDEFRVAARKFALDSDLVFGAISRSSRVAIIARERSIPLYELPPMRQETLHLLASTDRNELGQSYERTSLFAGKQKNQKDFAPIYLSPELWHTEYGNILNITDQMLKSWSENGNVEYAEFNYPKPVNWAFARGAVKDLQVSTLTYNWNTAGVGYEVEGEGCSIYALNRTGSLPVSYIPGETSGISESNAVYQAEEMAYDFFSGLSSPELVKVVQYVSMYQIFRNQGIRCQGYAYDQKQVFDLPPQLTSSVGKTVDALVRFGFDEKKKIAAHFGMELKSEQEFGDNADDNGWVDLVMGVQCKKVQAPTNGICLRLKVDGNSYLTIQNLETWKRNRRKVGRDDTMAWLQVKQLFEKLDALRKDLSYVENDRGFMGCLPAFLLDRHTPIQYSAPRISPISGLLSAMPTMVGNQVGRYEDRILRVLSTLAKYGSAFKQFNSIMGNITKEESKALYVGHNRDKSKTWMKCPTIVESWFKGAEAKNAEGGHNLDSKVLKFRLAEDLKPGQTRRLASGVVELSKADMRAYATNPAYLRRVGRLGNNELMTRRVPVRSRTVVLRRVGRRSARGFNDRDHLTVVAREKGFAMNGREVTLTELFDNLAESMAKGDTPVKEIKIVGLGGAGVKVSAVIDGVSYRMSKGPGANLALSRYDMANYTVSYSGDTAIIKIPLKPERIEYGSTSLAVDGERAVHGFNVKSGALVFEVQKSRLQMFLDALREFFKESYDFFNEMRLRRRIKQRDIDSSEFKMWHSFKFVKLRGTKKGRCLA